MCKVAAFILSLAFFLFPNELLAQDTKQLTQGQMAAVFLTSPAYQPFLENAINASEPPPLKAHCETLKIVSSDVYAPIQEPTFSLDGKNVTLRSGVWIARPILDACGKSVKRRILVQFFPETNTLQPVRLLPGDFIGDLRLESDARRIVSAGLLLKARCSDSKALYYLDIKNKPTDEPDTRIETWTANVCGDDLDIDVYYTRRNGEALIEARSQ